jgi:HSP20 family protein
MTVIRWTPANHRGPVAFGDEMERVLNSFFSAAPLTAVDRPVRVAPPVDVAETAEGYVFRADMPGLNPADVKVTLHGDTLTIRGERKRETAKSEGDVHSSERSFGTFERSFKLTAPLRGDQVKASYTHGVLEVRVPKADEARPREIEIQVG